MLKARELIIDFFNYAFLLILISFCIFYFTVGDRFLMFGLFLRTILPFSVFGVIFLINFKIKRNLLADLNIEGVLNEIIGYFTPLDKVKERIIVLIMVAAILATSVLNGNFNYFDFIQAAGGFFYIYLWHKLLFKPTEDVTQVIALRNIDKIKDELAIYLLPFFITGIGMFGPVIEPSVDFLQGASAMSIMLAWHFVLFNRER